MTELLGYLSSAQLVADIQRKFGVQNNIYHHQSQAHTHSSHDLKNQNQNQTQTPSSSTTSKTRKNSSLDINNNTTTDNNKTNANNKPDHNNNNNNNSNSISNRRKGKNNDDANENAAQSSDSPSSTSFSKDHVILIRFWYYFFHVGAACGNEIFYILFFPFWFWNVDGAIARKVGFLWGLFMYVGQATKDLICFPRPLSPPVVHLEDRYLIEYGFPSIHAMASAGLPVSLVILSHSRYNIDLAWCSVVAACFCLWVCCSRLYLGVHSVLDVVAGVLYSMLILALTMPYLDEIDSFMCSHPLAPYTAGFGGLLVCYLYPKQKGGWNMSRSDTTIIVGTVAGFAIGSQLNNELGYMSRPDAPPLYDIRFPDAKGYALSVCRTLLGLLLLFITRQVTKTVLFRTLCAWHKLDARDPLTKQQKRVELPYYYGTYICVGLNIAFVSPLVFRALNIQRDYSFTEL